MNDQITSAVRSALKIAGGYFVAKGFTDNSTMEIIVSGLAALIGVLWSVTHHAATPSATPPPPPATPPAP